MSTPDASLSPDSSSEHSEDTAPGPELASSLPYPAVKGFRVLHEEELLNRPPRRYIVDELIPERGVVLLFAPPKAKKSFVAQDICYHIATGRAWAGRAVVQGCVVYAAGERTDSLGERLMAWREVHSYDGRVGIKYVESVPNLMKAESVDAFIAAVKHIGEPVRLLVLDTLARCTVGCEENTSRDMQIAMTGAERIRSTLNCAVIIIHHSNKANTGERGSGAIRGAVDVLLRVETEGKEKVLVRVEAANDLPESDDIAFEVVSAGKSCALRFVGSTPSKGQNRTKLPTCFPTLALLASLGQGHPAVGIPWKTLKGHSTAGTLSRHLGEAMGQRLVVQLDDKSYRLTDAGQQLYAEATVAVAA